MRAFSLVRIRFLAEIFKMIMPNAFHLIEFRIKFAQFL